MTIMQITLPRFPWFTFGAGVAIGFLITVAANVAAKLAIIVAASFTAGFIIGKYWRR